MTANILISAMLIICVAFMLVWKIRFAPKSEFFENYLSVDETGSIKGMCAVFVLLSHLCMYFADDFNAFFLFKYVGAIMVGGFFFVSGYGLEYSMIHKKDYLKGFFLKRFMPIALTYYVINIFYIYASEMDKAAIIKSMFGYNPNLWFVMAIGIFYIGFYVCNRIFKGVKAAAAMTVFIAGYVIVMRLAGFGDWWYNSCIAFAIGIWWSLYKDKITAFLKKCYFLKLVVSVIIFAVSYALYCRHMHDGTVWSLGIGLVNTTMFPIMLAMLAMKIQIGNPLLSLCGRLSFELYLTHALLIHWLRNGFWHDVTGTFFDNQLTYLAGVAVGTLVFSIIIHVICQNTASLIKEMPSKLLKKTDKYDKIA